MTKLAEGEDASLFKMNNNVYRYTKTNSREAAEREIDICAYMAAVGIFPMIEMPVYHEDSGLLQITMENMDGTFSKLKKEIEAKGEHGEAGKLYDTLLGKLTEKIAQMHKFGICHGDLSANPNNIMYTGSLKGYKLYIIDFTTAKRNVNGCTNLDLNNHYYGFRRLQSRTSNKNASSTVKKLF